LRRNCRIAEKSKAIKPELATEKELIAASAKETERLDGLPRQ
jgi:hypothetical protein